MKFGINDSHTPQWLFQKEETYQEMNMERKDTAFLKCKAKLGMIHIPGEETRLIVRKHSWTGRNITMYRLKMAKLVPGNANKKKHMWFYHDECLNYED